MGSQDVTASAMAYSKSGVNLFRELIIVMVLGGHGFLGPRAGDEQEWSFDGADEYAEIGHIREVEADGEGDSGVGKLARIGRRLLLI